MHDIFNDCLDCTAALAGLVAAKLLSIAQGTDANMSYRADAMMHL